MYVKCHHDNTDSGKKLKEKLLDLLRRYQNQSTNDLSDQANALKIERDEIIPKLGAYLQEIKKYLSCISEVTDNFDELKSKFRRAEFEGQLFDVLTLKMRELSDCLAKKGEQGSPEFSSEIARFSVLEIDAKSLSKYGLLSEEGSFYEKLHQQKIENMEKLKQLKENFQEFGSFLDDKFAVLYESQNKNDQDRIATSLDAWMDKQLIELESLYNGENQKYEEKIRSLKMSLAFLPF